MPEGLTHKVQKGEQTFAEFVWRCARQIDYLGDMYGAANAAPICFEKTEFDYMKHATEELERDIKELERLDGLSEEEVLEEYAEYAEELRAWNNRRREEEAAAHKQYGAMLEKVNASNPPSEKHAGLWELMRKQLEDSIKWDCTPCDLGVELDCCVWYRDRINRLQKGIELSADRVEASRGRTEKRRLWLEALDAAVPIPEGLRKRGES